MFDIKICTREDFTGVTDTPKPYNDANTILRCNQLEEDKREFERVTLTFLFTLLF